MKKINTFFLIAIIATFLMSCGSSVESQQKGWTSNLKTVDSYKAKYPKLKAFLSEDVEAGTKVKKEAEGISDEKAKIKKMREANGKITSGILKNLKDLESKITDTKSKQASLKNAKVVADQKKFADEANVDAKKALSDADVATVATYSTKQEAIEAIKKQIKKLTEADSEVDRILAKTDDVNKKVEDDNKKIEEDNKKTEEAKKPIKCEYCASMNEPTLTKCKSCAAPIEKK